MSLHPWLAIGDAVRFEAMLYRQRRKAALVNGGAADIEECEDDPALAGLLCLETVGPEDEEIRTPLTDGRGNRIADRLGGGACGVFNRGTIASRSEGFLVQVITEQGLGTRSNRLVLGVSYDSSENDFAASTERGALSGDHSFSRLNPGVELDWAVTPDFTLRAGYAESNRVPTEAALSCADENAPCSLTNFFIADPPLEQVVARTFELGASGRHRGAGWDIDWPLSAYRASNSNDIQFVAASTRGRGFFENIGKTRRQGIEASLRARRGGWQVGASYAFIDATFRTPLVLGSPPNPEAGAAGRIAVARGDRLSGLPRHSATLTADYEGRIGGRAFALGGDLIARSGQFLVGDGFNRVPKVPGYAVFNLRGRIELLRGVSLFGELRNVFDRKFATFGTFTEVEEIDLAEAPSASDPRALAPGAPRRVTVGISARF